MAGFTPTMALLPARKATPPLVLAVSSKVATEHIRNQASLLLTTTGESQPIEVERFLRTLFGNQPG